MVNGKLKFFPKWLVMKTIKTTTVPPEKRNHEFRRRKRELKEQDFNDIEEAELKELNEQIDFGRRSDDQ